MERPRGHTIQIVQRRNDVCTLMPIMKLSSDRLSMLHSAPLREGEHS